MISTGYLHVIMLQTLEVNSLQSSFLENLKLKFWNIYSLINYI